MSAAALRPLSVGEILDVAFGLYRRHFATLGVIVMLCSGVPLLVNLYLQAAGGMLQQPLLGVLYVVLLVVLNSIGTAATTFVVSESYLGREVGPHDALRRAMPFVGRLIVTSLLFTLVAGLGLLLLIVPGIILFCGLVISTQAIVLEGAPGATAALGRSWSLTRGARGRIFGLMLVVAALIYIPMMALGFVAAIFAPSMVEAGAGGTTTNVVLAAVAGLVSMLVMPFFYCALTVAYYDLRVRKEAFDLEVLASTLQPQAA